MIEGLEGVVNMIDDLLGWGDSVEEQGHRLRKLLDRAQSRRKTCWRRLEGEHDHISAAHVRKKLEEFRTATAEDPEMQLLKDTTLRGWMDEMKRVQHQKAFNPTGHLGMKSLTQMD